MYRRFQRVSTKTVLAFVHFLALLRSSSQSTLDLPQRGKSRSAFRSPSARRACQKACLGALRSLVPPTADPKSESQGTQLPLKRLKCRCRMTSPSCHRARSAFRRAFAETFAASNVQTLKMVATNLQVRGIRSRKTCECFQTWQSMF